MFSRRPFAFGSVLLVLACLPGVALGDTLEVCPTCAHTTVQGAIDAASPGDVVDVAAGTYVENLRVDLALTIRGAGPGATILDGGAAGAVVTVSEAVVALEGVTVRNGSSDEGGGIRVLGFTSDVTLTDCELLDNVASFRGGGLFNVGGQVVITRNVIEGNQAQTGGGISSAGGRLTLDASTLAYNSATYGGGMYNNGPEVVITNSTISGNDADYAGGVGSYTAAAETGVVVLRNSTIANNLARAGGGGLYGYLQTDEFVLYDTIVADNTPQQCEPPGAMSSGGHNLASDATCRLDQPGDLPSTDPLLDPLADNGGPTRTHALVPGSPAEDAGSGACLPFDQRGEPREGACDIGAFERVDPDRDGDGIPNFDDICPDHFDPGQEDGDADGVGDACDLCPGLATGDNGDLDADGVGAPCDLCPDDYDPGQDDRDGDGLGDACDPCPDIPAGDPDYDQDWDGIPDACDNCVHRSNPGQGDADLDGVGDACDNCPAAVNPDQIDSDADRYGDACDNCPALANSQTDTDDDGVGDGCDICPTAPDPEQSDRDDDGNGDACDNCVTAWNTGQRDRDQDGLGDACDLCPDEANGIGPDADGDGVDDGCDTCPDVPDPGQLDSDRDGLGDACDPFPVALVIRTDAPAFAFDDALATAVFRLFDEHDSPQPDLVGVRASLTLTAGATFATAPIEGILHEGGGTDRILVEFVDGVFTIGVRGETGATVAFGGEDSAGIGIRMFDREFEDFEFDDGGYRTYGNIPDVWQWGIPTVGPSAAYSGDRVWGTVLDGLFPPYADVSVETPPIDLPRHGAPRLRYKRWLGLDGAGDNAKVQISADGGLKWSTLDYYPNSWLSWASGGEDLSPWAGSTVLIRFQLDTTGFYPHWGFYLDDVEIDDLAARTLFLVRNDDDDDDGLSNGEEVDLGTDPLISDMDRDGRLDGADNCPFTPNAYQEDRVHPNGIGDWCEDPDGDGVVDFLDVCPDTVDPDQLDGDDDGIGDACDLYPDRDLVLDVFVPGEAETTAPVVLHLRVRDRDGTLATDLIGAQHSLSLDGPAVFGDAAIAGTLADGAGTATAVLEFEEGVASVEIVPTGAGVVRLVSALPSETGMYWPTDRLYDFENDDGGFYHGGVYDAWEWGPPTSGPFAADSGQNVWATRLDGPPPRGSKSYLRLPVMRPDAFQRSLSVYYSGWYDVADVDSIRLRFSRDDGSTWEHGGLYSGRDSGQQYRNQGAGTQIDAAERIFFRFELDTRFDRDASEAGLYIDDVVIRNLDVTIDFLDPDADLDGDGLTLIEERRRGGDPWFRDTDVDGLDDGSDNCPAVENPEQVDRDGNGIGDVCDDSDGDGIIDVHDLCPGASDPAQEDRNGNGVGDACDDPDGDGAFDATDVCPDVFDPDQADGDTDGFGDLCDICPAVANPEQDELAACVDIRPRTATCIAADVERTVVADRGDVTVVQGGVEIGRAPIVDGSLPERVVIAGAAPGPAQVCASRREGYAIVLLDQQTSTLFRVDPSNADLEKVGRFATAYVVQPLHDGTTDEFWAVRIIDYRWALSRVDTVNGTLIGAPMYPDLPYGARTFRFTKGRLFVIRRSITTPDVDLVEVDLDTGMSTRIGPTGMLYVRLLARRPSDGALIAMHRVSGSSNDTLSVVDTTDGGSELLYVSDGPGQVYEMAYADDDRLYGLVPGFDSYRWVEIVDGEHIEIASLPEGLSPRLTSVDDLRIADCIDVELTGNETALAINGASCGPPVANAGVDRTAECASWDGASFVLDGSASTDPDSSAGTNDDIVSFDWIEDAGLPTEAPLGDGETLEVVLPLGEHAITLRATDSYGESDDDTVVLTVEDTTPPVIAVDLAPGTLWPPNHRMVDVTADVVATDVCGPVAVTLVSADSDEADDATGAGDGKTVGDIQGASIGTDDRSVGLRAERDSKGDGRVYTLGYAATDLAGLTSSASARAYVPLNQGNGTEPVRIDVGSSGGGTTVTWDAVPSALAYSVIRGDLAALRQDAEAIHLGTVACVEAEDIDLDTTGNEDTEVPPPGTARFYLVEYHDGWNSSYGLESLGLPRVVDDGGCR